MRWSDEHASTGTGSGDRYYFDYFVQGAYRRVPKSLPRAFLPLIPPGSRGPPANDPAVIRSRKPEIPSRRSAGRLGIPQAVAATAQRRGRVNEAHLQGGPVQSSSASSRSRLLVLRVSSRRSADHAHPYVTPHYAPEFHNGGVVRAVSISVTRWQNSVTRSWCILGGNWRA
jgi:hypothetical protein